MPGASIAPIWPQLTRTQTTILFVDLVESVRLLEADEELTVRRWQLLAGHIVNDLLPRYGGRLVKGFGDGLMLRFEAIPAAMQFALELRPLTLSANQGISEEMQLRLRVGAHAADVIVADDDLFGSGVSLAARFAALAEPDEIIVSSEIRDGISIGLDANVEDLGLCYFKHVSRPVHAFRVIPAQQPLVVTGRFHHSPLSPAIAVVPLEGLRVEAPNDLLGEVIADGVIGMLSTARNLRVISRLSTSTLRSRRTTVPEIGALLGATFVLIGSYRIDGARVQMTVELADTRNNDVLFREAFVTTIEDVFHPLSDVTERLCTKIVSEISASELRRVQSFALPSMEGFSLQFAAMNVMHHSTKKEFKQARPMLEHLIDRYPRTPTPRAWLAKWYVLRVTRGLVLDVAAESDLALEQTRRAMDASADCAMALAVEGFIYCHMLRDLDGAQSRLDRAIQINDSEPLAWLFKCVVHAFRGEGAEGMHAAEKAISLSPLDPMRHYYDGLASSAALAGHELDHAIELATRSLRVNRNHLPTLRVLAIAQSEQGAIDQARLTVQRILALEPGFKLHDYLARCPRGGELTRERYVRALAQAGVPMQ